MKIVEAFVASDICQLQLLEQVTLGIYCFAPLA